MSQNPGVKVSGLDRYLIKAPSWPRSLAIIIIFGLIIDAAGIRAGLILPYFGTTCFIIPAVLAFLVTKPLVALSGSTITWNRSALLSMTMMVFCIIVCLPVPVLTSLEFLPIFYAMGIGLIFGLRLLVLTAVANYRVRYMVLPALIQSAAGLLLGSVIFEQIFFKWGVLAIALFGAGFYALIWFIEQPIKSIFHISGLSILNAFIAHLTDGSKNLEDFFREIGEEVEVPQANIFFRREAGKKDILFTVPNVHPGPMGEIGGGNLPSVLHESFDEEVLTAHGCATHDFNLVSESEIQKIVEGINESRGSIVFSSLAGKSERLSFGSVDLLVQRFGDSMLMVSTRSPEVTEDIDFSLGMIIMAEGRRTYKNVAFVDGHNCMIGGVTPPVMPATRTGSEYLRAALTGFGHGEATALQELRSGVSHIITPFSREEGLGDLGIQSLVIETGGQKTAYVLIDGNNMSEGVREYFLDIIHEYADDGEVMTSDTHVVNTLHGKNAIGQRAPPEKIGEYMRRSLEEAIEDLSPSEVAMTTAECRGVNVFGSQRVSQLASTINAMLLFIAPLCLAILMLAFLITLVAFFVMG